MFLLYRLCNCDIREHKIYSTWPTQTKLLRYVDQDRLFLQNDTINDYRRHHLTCWIIYSEHDRLIVSPSWKIGAVREDHEPWTMRIHFCLQNFSGWWSRKTKSNAFKKLLKPFSYACLRHKHTFYRTYNLQIQYFYNTCRLNYKLNTP